VVGGGCGGGGGWGGGGGGGWVGVWGGGGELRDLNRGPLEDAVLEGEKLWGGTRARWNSRESGGVWGVSETVLGGKTTTRAELKQNLL